MPLIYNKESTPFDDDDELNEFLASVFLELRENLENAKNSENNFKSNEIENIENKLNAFEEKINNSGY
jgi:hypothetical protein